MRRLAGNAGVDQSNIAQPQAHSAFSIKLSPPLPTPLEVPRHQVCARVLAAHNASVILLRAPAGFGKTTTMLQLWQQFRQAGFQCAWVTLDSADNDVARFAAVLTAAADNSLVKPPQNLAEEGASPHVMALSLLAQVTEQRLPFVLFLDDFEVLHDRASLGLVREAIERLPHHAKIVIGSRSVPDLSLGRLRSQGRLLEIDQTQLRFTIAESERFLRVQHRLDLSAEDVAQLHDRTEGWAAALRLASISLEDNDRPANFIANFSGSNEAIVEYLIQDVLAKQPKDIQTFLLRTSILDHLEPSLCNLVYGGDAAAAILRHLERANLFLLPLQGEHGGYRYHGMFAQFLRDQLQQLHPKEIPHLHSVACAWFLAQGRIIPAINHALAANDHECALALLESHAQHLLAQGRSRLLARWLEPLQSAGKLDAHPQLLLVHSWAQLFCRGPHATVAQLDALESKLDGAGDIAAHLIGMRVFSLALMDRFEETFPLAAAASAGLPAKGFARAIFDNTMANVSMMTGRYQEARRFADAARSRLDSGPNSFNFSLSEAVEGAIDLSQGRLKQALARLRLVVAGSGTDNANATQATGSNAMVSILLAEALYEADECNKAERLLYFYVPLIRNVGIPDQVISAHVIIARIMLLRGETEMAFQLLSELEQLGYRGGLPRLVASARLERCRMQLVGGQVAGVREELGRCGDAQLWQRVEKSAMRANDVETLSVGLARCAIYAGHGAEAIASLRQEIDSGERNHRLRRVLTLRILLAAALHQDGQQAKAMRVLAKAVSFAAANGYVRAFADEGPYVAELLRRLRATSTALLEADGEASPAAFLDRLLRQDSDQAAKPAEEPLAPAIVPDATDANQMTSKELRVLSLAAEGLSNAEIAARMLVAVTTVRTHLRAINLKLAAHNRMEAVALARRKGLIA